MLRTELQPYLVFHDLEHNESDSKLKDWPLHLTLTPPFTLSGVKEYRAADLIASVVEDIEPFKIEIGDEDAYGPNNERVVTKLNDNEGILKKLHTSLIERLGAIGCKFSDLTYALENYSAHISHQAKKELPEHLLTIESVSFAKKRPKFILPNSIRRHKLIVERMQLRENLPTRRASQKDPINALRYE